jgi:hypothetical protein
LSGRCCPQAFCIGACSQHNRPYTLKEIWKCINNLEHQFLDLENQLLKSQLWANHSNLQGLMSSNNHKKIIRTEQSPLHFQTTLLVLSIYWLIESKIYELPSSLVLLQGFQKCATSRTRQLAQFW